MYMHSEARLTKAYDVTIQRYRNSHAKIEDSKMHILRCMGSNFVWNFKGALWNLTQNFEPIHHKIWILRDVKNLTTYDILELWHLKCKWGGPLVAYIYKDHIYSGNHLSGLRDIPTIYLYQLSAVDSWLTFTVWYKFCEYTFAIQ